MRRREFIGSLALGSLRPGAQAETPGADPRNIKTGWVIPKEGYCDQPYVVITNDGNWLCVLTTGNGVEASPEQHVVATIGSDNGRSWSPLIAIEPAQGPEASWVMPLATPAHEERYWMVRRCSGCGAGQNLRRYLLFFGPILRSASPLFN